MAFVDAGAFRARAREGRALEPYYRELIGRSELLGGCVGPSLEGGVLACDATCYADTTPIGEDFIKVGEASFAIDPQMAQAWLGRVPLQKGVAIAGWLYRNGLFTEA
jgi:hypothetical protein